MRAINYIDSTATEQLTKIILTLKKQGIRVMLVGAIGPARDVILKSENHPRFKKKKSFYNLRRRI